MARRKKKKNDIKDMIVTGLVGGVTFSLGWIVVNAGAKALKQQMAANKAIGGGQGSTTGSLTG